jgi:CRP-like cAMP-binding protein
MRVTVLIYNVTLLFEARGDQCTFRLGRVLWLIQIMQIRPCVAPSRIGRSPYGWPNRVPWDDADRVYEIVRGMVKLYKLLPDGRRQITGFISAGDLMGLSRNVCFMHTAEAVTDVAMFCIPKSRFDRFIDEAPGFSRFLLNAAHEELHLAHEQLLLLGRKTAMEKIASFLLSMSVRFGTAVDAHETVIPVPMRRSDIADYLGLTIETVSRGLSRLKKDGIVKDMNCCKSMSVFPGRLVSMASGEGGAGS